MAERKCNLIGNKISKLKLSNYFKINILLKKLKNGTICETAALLKIYNKNFVQNCHIEQVIDCDEFGYFKI